MLRFYCGFSHAQLTAHYEAQNRLAHKEGGGRGSGGGGWMWNKDKEEGAEAEMRYKMYLKRKR